jgi:hypothetical protein
LDEAGLRAAAGLAGPEGLVVDAFGFARLLAGRAGRFAALVAAAWPLEVLAVADLPLAALEAAGRARVVAAGLRAAVLELLEDCLAGACLVVAGAALRCVVAERAGEALLRDASACAAASST